MIQQSDQNGKRRMSDAVSPESGRKAYSAAKIEAISFNRDVITTSVEGGENGYGVRWNWDTKNIWGE